MSQNDPKRTFRQLKIGAFASVPASGGQSLV